MYLVLSVKQMMCIYMQGAGGVPARHQRLYCRKPDGRICQERPRVSEAGLFRSLLATNGGVYLLCFEFIPKNDTRKCAGDRMCIGGDGPMLLAGKVLHTTHAGRGASECVLHTVGYRNERKASTAADGSPRGITR